MPLVSESGNLLKPQSSSSTWLRVAAGSCSVTMPNDAVERLGDPRGVDSSRSRRRRVENCMATRPSSSPQFQSPRAFSTERGSMRLRRCDLVSHRLFSASSTSPRNGVDHRVDGYGDIAVGVPSDRAGGMANSGALAAPVFPRQQARLTCSVRVWA
jgi:hypothetical protein